MTVAHRDMKPADRDFVISAWSSSFRTSPYAGMVLMSEWAPTMHRMIGAILDRRDTRVVVACEPGELLSDGKPFLYGFIAVRAGRTPYVYYCYVKAPYREGRERHGMANGHAAQLFAAAGVDPSGRFGYACKTSYCKQLAHRIPLAEWQPLSARFEEPQ